MECLAIRDTMEEKREAISLEKTGRKGRTNSFLDESLFSKKLKIREYFSR